MYSVEETENMVQKIGEFEKSKLGKSGVIYKGFLRQTQGTNRPRKKFEKMGNSKNSMFEKLGFNCISIKVTYETNHMSLLCDSTMSNALNFVFYVFHHNLKEKDYIRRIINVKKNKYM